MYKICANCNAEIRSKHLWCDYISDREAEIAREAALERLDTYCQPKWLEDFKERWEFWKFLKPDTLVGDRESNKHLIRTGYYVPQSGLPALGNEDYYNADDYGYA
jgi:hypothetical protein